MGFVTKAFGLFHKRLRAQKDSSSPYWWRGFLNEFWYDEDSTTPRISSSFLNFPKDGVTTTYTTTRNLSDNLNYRALPWGSMACDLLWNVTVPSWSFTDQISSGTDPNDPLETVDRTERFWTVNTHTSKSFFSQSLYYSTPTGVKDYSVTSSWKIIDPKFISPGTASGSASFSYIHLLDGRAVPAGAYPTFVGADYFNPSNVEESDRVAYDVTWPNIFLGGTSSYDGQYFDYGGGAGITRKSISQSLVTLQTNYSGTTTGEITAVTRALKERRLFFPTPVSGSGTQRGTDYHFKSITGYAAKDVFTENGGIYSVELTLKRSPTLNDFYPDPETYMSVFIHEVITQAPAPASRVPGASGWYPPENNIVRIGNAFNGGPAISFYDIQTGYLYEKFNFNVIQYGYPAQLCIEPTGSLLNDSYFGIIVDDIRICKIGVTTDPRFLKPTTIGETIGSIRNPFQNISNPAPPGGGS